MSAEMMAGLISFGPAHISRTPRYHTLGVLHRWVIFDVVIVQPRKYENIEKSIIVLSDHADLKYYIKRITTKSNLDEHLTKITGEVCQTVYDAILVTRKLGLRYLWLDALCIIQDDDEHKLEQTASLGKVFEDAYVSIIANGSKNSDYGFLKDNRIRPTFELPCRAQNGQLGKISLTALEPRKIGTAQAEVQHLELRAWAYQELLLSKRCIKYDRAAITWNCTNDIGLEVGIHAWTEHINKYSGKEMTDPCDKLPAISSLAAHYSLQMPESKYLAGFFSGETHHQLCWYSPVTAKRLSRPMKWRAPSWSPFSVDGVVMQWHCFSDTGHVPPFLVENDGTYHTSFDILDSGIEPLSEKAPFGRIKSGFLQVRGQLMALRKDTLSAFDKIGNIFGGLGLPMKPDFGGGSVGTIYFDTVNCIGTRIISADSIQTTHGSLTGDTQLFALKICKKKVTTVLTDQDTNQQTHEVKHWDAGLVLVQLKSGNGDFIRVGRFICNKKDAFPAGKYMQILRIV